MLRNLRAFAGSAVGAIFILLLALPFVANTGQGPQSTGTQGSSVVSTEGERFYDIEVQRAANLTFLQSADLVTGNPRTVDEARALDGWQRVENAIVSQLTQQPIQLAELGRQQWTASEEEIVADMVNDPQFQVAGEYVKLLAEQALDTPEKEAYYIQQKRVEINARRLQEFADRYAPTFTPTPIVEAAFDFQNRLYGFDAIQLLASNEDVGAPTSNDLDAIFDENSELYRTQEMRELSAIVVSPALYLSGEATDDALAAAAEQATATINLMLDTQQNGITPEGSLDILDATLEDLAAAGSLDIVQFDPVDRFGRDATGNRNEAAATTVALLSDGFQLNAVGDLSELRDLGDGNAIVVRLDGLTESRPQTREEADSALAQTWEYQAQTEQLRARVDVALTDLANGSISFETFAADENADVQALELLDAAGLQRQGISPVNASGMGVGDVEASNLGLRTTIYRLRELGQQDQAESAISYDAVQSAINGFYRRQLTGAFLQELEENADITINEREFANSLNAAVLTANNAGYFDGTATEASVRNAMAGLQSGAQ